MSGMDQFLAEYYGTGKTVEASVDDTEKQAQIELFAKMAAAEGIDLESMSDEQVAHLFNETFKTASEEEKKEKSEKSEEANDHDSDDEKKAAAAAEFAEKQAAAEKVAEADFLGRVMAHAYVQELNKIASAGPEDETKEASKMRSAFEALKGHAGKAADKAGKHLEHVGKKVTEKATGAGTHGMKPSHAKAVGGATYGAGAAAAGGAAAATKAMMGKKKESSAIDDLAAQLAVEKAAAAGWDTEEAAARIGAVMTLGPSQEGSKIASATTLDAAVDIRSAELLEMAGYPVSWA